MSNDGRPTLPVQESSDLIVIAEGTKYKVPILPKSPNHLDREIRIGDEAEILRKVYGKSVDIGMQCEVLDDIFAEEKLDIAEKNKIKGNLISSGKVEIDKGCVVGEEGDEKNIIGKQVRVGSDVEVFGSIIADGDIVIGDNCWVKGVVISNYGDIRAGKSLHCRDVLCRGKLEISDGAYIKDNVIWGGDGLRHGSIDLAGNTPESKHYRTAKGAEELNLNITRCKVDENKSDHLSVSKKMKLAIKKRLERDDVY